MDNVKTKLIEAEKKAKLLFAEVQRRSLIVPGKSEIQINAEIFNLAHALFGIKKFWHKRIVRSGPNTLHPYSANPPDLTILENDIIFLDFGPIFEDWEADLGRTFVLGNDPHKRKLKQDIEKAWHEAKQWFHTHTSLTGAEFFKYIFNLSKSYGWDYGAEIGGHLIGHFPHEKLEPGNYGLYIHTDNHNDMFALDSEGRPRHWILEIHFVDRERQIGGFFEQLLT